MDWMQVLTILAATIGSTYAFYMITERKIDKMEAFHREDMARMDEKFIRMDEKFIRMDEKWERLFEKLLIKEQGKAG